MATRWSHRIAPSISSDEAIIRYVSWSDAQTWCNFVLFRPEDLPPGLTLERGSLRPEAPPGRPEDLDNAGRFAHNFSNRASYQFHISGNRRKLEVKEFLYDLGPPAWDHPVFWLSGTEAFEAGRNIVWIGTDFRGRRAASVATDRTTAEISVLSGYFSDEELLQICTGLRPICVTARQKILATSLGELCYQRRYPDLVVTVPMGYWTHRRRPASLQTTVLAVDELDIADPPLSIPPEFGFRLDTIFVFGDLKAPQEVEYVWEHCANPGRCTRVLVWDIREPNSPKYPPIIDRQPCSQHIVDLGGTDVFHAYRDSRYGQHEAVWRRGRLMFMLMTKPTPETTLDWFEDFLRKVIES